MDNIQFNKNGWQNRNKIKCQDGWMYLSIPISHKFQQRIDEVKIDNAQNWRQKHWNTLVMNYSKAKYFKDYKDFFEKLYKQDWDSLNEINYEMLYYFLGVLNIKTKIVKSSDLSVDAIASERLVNICKKLCADTYLSGAYALEVYLDENAFKEAGIKIVLQEWHCPEYQQQFPQAGFVPDMSIVDLLFNHGPEARNILFKNAHPTFKA